ncbi:MAG TPA: hypothetical protein VKS79_22505 [Gemmataceae bacterium]|nr:hypothetical protein [Gemmataceae bacterium]
MPPTNNSKPTTQASAITAKPTTKAATVPAKKKPGEEEKKKPMAPPEGTFWQTYSANGEFPFSSIGSFMIHAIVLFVVLGGVFALFSHRDTGEELEPVLVGDGGPGGGGGDPNGIGDAPGNLRPPDAEESLEKPDPNKPIDKTPQPDVDLKDKATKIADDPDAADTVKKTPTTPPKIAAMPSLKDGVQGIAGKGRGGEGQGGGFGKGIGKGVGDKWGTGPRNKRGARQDRWKMIFDTRNGNDYVRQLNALNTILRFDTGNKAYVVRNLSERPAKPVELALDAEGRPTDPELKMRNWWLDDDKDSCQAVKEALGLPFTPDAIYAYFPIAMEESLVKKELAYGKTYGRTKEEDIGETRFKVEFQRGTATINVIYQEGKK